MSDHRTEGADKPLTDLPVSREHVPKGTTVYPNGTSVEVHYGYDVLHAWPVEAVFSPGEAD